MPQPKWELKGHSYQIADTGDYDGHFEITNGKISIFTKDDFEDGLQPIVDALNESECDFYLDDSAEFLAHHFQEENKRSQTEIERLKSGLYVKPLLEDFLAYVGGNFTQHGTGYNVYWDRGEGEDRQMNYEGVVEDYLFDNPEYAAAPSLKEREMAIGFRNWVAINGYEYQADPFNCWVQFDENGIDSYLCDTDEQLCDLYLESLNKKP